MSAANLCFCLTVVVKLSQKPSLFDKIAGFWDVRSCKQRAVQNSRMKIALKIPGV